VGWIIREGCSHFGSVRLWMKRLSTFSIQEKVCTVLYKKVFFGSEPLYPEKVSFNGKERRREW
jgi:hypothetical protein